MIGIKSLYRLTLALGLLALSSHFTYGQEVDKSEIFDKSNVRNRRLANEAIRTGNRYLAIEYLEKIYQNDSTKMDIVLELADLYRLTHNYRKTELFYSKVVNSKWKEKYPDAFFYLGQAQKNNGKYSEAKANFLLFKKKMGNVKDPSLKKLYKTELEGCEIALTTPTDSALVQVRNMGEKINQPHIDFSPIPIGDNELIFGSYPEREERVYKISDTVQLELAKRQFFVAERTDGEWQKKGSLPGPFNDSQMDIANGCFSLDSSKFYFTKCAENWQNKIECAIYVSEKSGSTWGDPVKLGEEINLPNFTSTHPTIGRESKRNHEVLYFASNREGSKGGLDIWFSEFDPRKNSFKKARNAGSKINSVGDEVTPFYDLPSKTLYFSTDSKATFGGLDIFSAVGETSKWEESKNIGPEINSSADDLDYALKPSNRGGYFVSNRIGGLSLYHPTCCDDLYEFEYSKFIEILDKTCIVDTKKNPINGKTTINIYLKDSTGNLLLVTRSNEQSCKDFELRPGKLYVVEAKSEGYFSSTIEVDTREIFNSTKLTNEIILEEQPKEPIIISNIQYDFDSPNLTAKSKNILDTTLLLLIQKYPNLKFEIAAHTDSKGSDEYNLKLSQKRAESVVKYLASKGVPLVQMSAKGYGETLPIAPNTNEDGSDNPSGREKNRRTEFKIVGEIDIEIINIDDEN